jgi:IS30 family transposase
MTCTHLTQAERYQIEILFKAGHKKSAIARLMERDKSCISRELYPAHAPRARMTCYTSPC